jgi:cytidylate kinase
MGDPRIPVLAIDGPSGSGKGTVARALAATLGWHLLDSGALYRLVGLAGERAGLAADDEAGHAALAATLPVTFGQTAAGEERILLAGEEVTALIRAETAGRRASEVAAFPAVRRALVDRQHAFRKPPGLVADGRDMGTVIFPDAGLKVFLTASAAARAKRRYQQLQAAGILTDLAVLTEEIAARDTRDANRAVSPLIPAPDSVQIDSTALSAQDVINEVLALVKARSSAG